MIKQKHACWKDACTWLAGLAGPSGDARRVSVANRERLEQEAVNKRPRVAGIIHRRNERLMAQVSS